MEMKQWKKGLQLQTVPSEKQEVKPPSSRFEHSQKRKVNESSMEKRNKGGLDGSGAYVLTK